MPATTRPNASRPARPGKKNRKPVARPASGMSTNLKFTIGVVVAVLAVVVGAVIFASNSGTGATGEPANLVRAESHRLDTAADGKVTVVEFLDFECPACGAAYPGVERLRAEYAGKITYVVRHFPLEMHPNAQAASLAAQAAGNQGKFAQMYQKLYDNQQTWGNQPNQAPTFEGYAQELGLDMTRFRADLAAPETAQAVETDRQDGIAAGVTGTPTFFINGKQFEETPTYDNLKAAIDAALAG